MELELRPGQFKTTLSSVPDRRAGICDFRLILRSQCEDLLNQQCQLAIPRRMP